MRCVLVCCYSNNKQQSSSNMQNIKALNVAQIKALTVHFFNCKNATEIAVNITATILQHKKANASASFTQQLTIANNLNTLENLLVVARNNKYFCVQTYIKALKQLQSNAQHAIAA